LTFNVLAVRRSPKALCGLVHQKNPSFRNWKSYLKKIFLAAKRLEIFI
jgi:hypothetical protein